MKQCGPRFHLMLVKIYRMLQSYVRRLGNLKQLVLIINLIQLIQIVKDFWARIFGCLTKIENFSKNYEKMINDEEKSQALFNLFLTLRLDG